MFAGVLLNVVETKDAVHRHGVFLSLFERQAARCIISPPSKKVSRTSAFPIFPLSPGWPPPSGKNTVIGFDGKSAVGFCSFHTAFSAEQKGIVFVKLFGRCFVPRYVFC